MTRKGRETESMSIGKEGAESGKQRRMGGRRERAGAGGCCVVHEGFDS